MNAFNGRDVLGGERLVAVDVGAANGLLPHWKVLGEIASVYMFEPEPEAFRLLQAAPQKGVTVLPIAVSGTGGPRTLYVTMNRPTGSSLLPMNIPEVFEYCSRDDVLPIKEIPVETRTLAAVFEDCKEPVLDMIKLDAQGAELEILEGLDPARSSALLSVEIEIGMPGGYKGQARFVEVQAYMDRYGLDLFDLRPQHTRGCENGRKGFYQSEVFGTGPNDPSLAPKIWEVDALYFRRPEPLLAAGAVNTIRKLIAAYCVYRFFIEAHKLATRAHSAGLTTTAQHNAILGAILCWHKEAATQTEPSLVDQLEATCRERLEVMQRLESDLKQSLQNRAEDAVVIQQLRAAREADARRAESLTHAQKERPSAPRLWARLTRRTLGILGRGASRNGNGS